MSAPEKLPLLQPRVQKLVELASDSTISLEQKQAKIASVVEADVLDFLEKGAGVESDLLQQFKSLLPQTLAEQVPTPTAPRRTAPAEQAATFSDVAEDVGPAYTNERSSLVVTDMTDSAPMPTSDAQTAAALVELRTAVSAAQACIDQFAANEDPARTTMLRINIQEARDRLNMRILEIEGSGAQAPALTTAIAEAKDLVNDISKEL